MTICRCGALAGLPDGLVALGRTRGDGTLPRDRRGRTAVRRAVLAAAPGAPNCPPGTDPALLPDPAWRWLTAVPSRRWETVQARLGDGAWEAAVSLARAGVLTIVCSVDGIRAGAPERIELTAPWAAAALDRRGARTAGASGLRDAAQALADQVRGVDEGLADALDAVSGHEPATAPVLVAAARDLLAGTVHGGPRAFSQAHFGDTKARDDAPAILVAAGAGPDVLSALGLVRSPHLGLGGPVLVTGTSGPVDLRGFQGPVRFRVGTKPFQAALADDAPRPVTLAVVENLQAAETVCDAHGADVAVAWCAGQPADGPLAVIASLAATAGRILVAPDADWGGARIAARIAGALPEGTPFEVLDPGLAPHPERPPFADGARDGLFRLAGTHPREQVRAFAAAVLARGYPVEQEASARAVLSRALR